MNQTRLTEKIPPRGPSLDISFSGDLLLQLTKAYAELGDIFCAHAPATGRDIYVLSHPDHVKHILVSNNQNYTKGLGIERVGILLGKGLMVSEGDLWRRQRKMIQPGFHPQAIARIAEHIHTANVALRDKWHASATRRELINLTQDMSEVSLTIVLRALFSEDFGALTSAPGGNPFSILTEDTERNLNFAYKFRQLGKLIMECIERRRQSREQPPDLLSLMMEARDRKSDEAMPDRQLLDEVMTLIVAGHETTASALNWMWYLLSQHPEAEHRLHEEVDALHDEPTEVSDLAKLSYTRQVIDETLRLYPPGWLLTRRTIDEDLVDGYPLAAGTDVFLCPYIVHRRPDFWERPEEFNPDRFSERNSQGRNRFAYLPFALGPRACIGEHLALVEMVMHTALMARSVRLRYVPQQPLELECQVNLRTKHSLMMMPELRRND
jgi:cytochrome P450